MPIKDFLQTDPADFANELPTLAIIKPVTYASATQTLGTVPANSVILSRRVIRTTAWSAITAFKIGKAGDTDWLMTTAQAAVTGSIPGGEAGAVAQVDGQAVVTEPTPIVLTLNQGGASAGAGYVVIEYQELSR